LGGKAEDAPKRDALKAKKSNMDAAIKDLQSEVDTKARERGEYIGKVLSSEKIKGKMELVKRASGQEDNPTKKKELADSFKELNRRFAEEQSAIKELQNKEKEKEAAKKAEEPKREEPKKEEPAKEEPKKDANTELEADIKSYNKNIADERASVEKAKEELKSETDPEKVAKLKDSIQKSKEDIAELQNSVKDLKAELKKNASPKESLMFSATELGLNELASEISTKENWQLENNSALYAKYKMMIDRQSSSNKINESNAISIADKFRMLLG
jgi:chromosome segregation ATPase